MGDVCSPEEKDKVKAILMKINELNREELKNEIKKCARQTGLDVEKLTSSLGKISDITQEEITAIVSAASGSESGSESGSPPTPAEGGKRKSKKSKSNKSKSKKRRSKRRKYRKMRRTRK